jgi:hypothetical protein
MSNETERLAAELDELASEGELIHLQSSTYICKKLTEAAALLRAQQPGQCASIKIKRELFSFSSELEWVNKAQRWYANCGVQKGFYITTDANGHVMHRGLCFKHAAYPVTCYELQTNWADTPPTPPQGASNASES